MRCFRGVLRGQLVEAAVVGAAGDVVQGDDAGDDAGERRGDARVLGVRVPSITTPSIDDPDAVAIRCTPCFAPDVVCELS